MPLFDVLKACIGERQDFPVGVVNGARAYDTLNPGALRQVNGNLWAGTLRADVPRALYPIAGLPGVRFANLTLVDVSGVTGADAPTSWLDGSADVRKFPGIIGAANVDFLDVLHSLWNKIGRAGFYTHEQIARVHAVLNAGVLAFPATPATLTNAAPTMDPTQYEPPGLNKTSRAAWVSICEMFGKAYAEYAKKNLQSALSQVRAADADVAFWDAIYTAVKFIADLPANAAGAVLSAAGNVFLQGPILKLAGLLAAGAFVWFFWPAIVGKTVQARAAQTKTKKAAA